MAGYLFDTNVWVALSFRTHPAHRLARGVFVRASESEPAWFCRSTEQSLLRLMTLGTIQRAYRAEHFTNRVVVETLRQLQINVRVKVMHLEPDGTRALWLELASLDSASPKVWMDAYLAACAIRGNLRLVTLDRDFRSWASQGLQLELLSC